MTLHSRGSMHLRVCDNNSMHDVHQKINAYKKGVLHYNTLDIKGTFFRYD